MKMTPTAQPVLFYIRSRNFYLVSFKVDNPKESFTPREVRECLKNGGYSPADVRSDDEVVTHPEIKGHDGLIGLFGTTSDDPTEAHRVAFLNKGEFRFYNESTGFSGPPHPVLCFK